MKLHTLNPNAHGNDNNVITTALNTIDSLRLHPHRSIAAFIKLVGLCALFLPVAVHLGFRTDKLVAILVMLGSATTVSSFVMAKNMGHEGTLSSSVVMLTTMFSAFTLTGWIYILKHFMLI